MANWAVGTFKVRGKKEDIKRFLMQGLGAIQPISYAIMTAKKEWGEDVEVPKELELEYDGDDCSLRINAPEGIYIKGARRAFFESNIWWEFEEDEKEIHTLVIDSFNQAWGVSADDFVEISKRYNLDIKIYVFERGMEFNQDVEIHKGEIIKNNEIQFADYEWECLFPNLGG